MTGEPRIASEVGIFSNGIPHAAVLQTIGE